MATKKLPIAFLLGFILVTATGAYLFSIDNNLNDIKPTIDASLSEDKTQVSKHAQPEFSELTEQEVNQLNYDEEAKRKQLQSQIEQYNYDRGYASQETVEQYQNYTINMLQELGKNGDIYALTELGLRASNEANYKLSFSYFESAAIYGSTVALGYLRNHYEMANQLYLDEKNGRRALMGAISYFRVAELRGDYSNSDLSEKYLSNYGAHSSGTYDEVKLDENDLQEVDKMAQQIYDALEKRRVELGLGPFDNSIPEGSTAQLHKEMAQGARQE